MISNKASLASRLGWVKEDLMLLLKQTEQQLEDYTHSFKADGQSEQNNLFQLLDELLGVLSVIRIKGATMLVEEIILVLQDMQKGKIQPSNILDQVLAESFVRLEEYLEHIEAGYADLPVVILPLLNNLRATREVELLSEHLVFLPEKGKITNKEIGIDEYIILPEDRKMQTCIQLRYFFQKALVSWYQNKSADIPLKPLKGLQQVTNALIKMSQSDDTRAFWWVAGALAQAVALKKIENTVAVKLLMGQIEREILAFSQYSTEIYNNDLLKNLLYYVGLSEAGSEKLDQVKKAYRLDIYLPQGETLEELRQHYSVSGMQSWKIIATSMQENLQNIAKSLEVETETENEVLIPHLISKTQNIVGTLSMIGLSQAADIFNKNIEILEKKVSIPFEKEERIQLASSYLKLQQVLDEYGKTGADITEDVFSQAKENTIRLRSNQYVYVAILEELKQIRSYIVAFIKEEQAFFQLSPAVEHLENIRGALIILSNKELVPLVDASLRYLRDDLYESRRQVSEKELAIFADVLTVVESCINALQNNEDYFDILNQGFNSLDKLTEYSNVGLYLQEDLGEAKEIASIKKKHFQKIKIFPNRKKKLSKHKRQPLGLTLSHIM